MTIRCIENLRSDKPFDTDLKIEITTEFGGLSIMLLMLLMCSTNRDPTENA